MINMKNDRTHFENNQKYRESKIGCKVKYQLGE